MFRANAIYEGHYLLGTSIARPLIAKRQMEIARIEGADAVSHGATGKGNDQVRFELGYYHFNPGHHGHRPVAGLETQQPQGAHRLREKEQHPHSRSPRSAPGQSDRNLLHISFEGGILEDTWAEPPENMFVLTRPPEKAPNKPQYVEIEFRNGNAVAVDGEKMSPAQLLAHLNYIGGEHGIGRVDLLENRSVGMKSRGVYETPGGTILREAHMAVEQITMDREVMRVRDSLIPEYARMIYAGYWFSPEREMLQSLIDDSQKMRQRRGADQALQGALPHRREEVGDRFPLQPRLCHLREGPGLQPEGRGRFHQDQLPQAAHSLADAGCQEEITGHAGHRLYPHEATNQERGTVCRAPAVCLCQR